jgi:hypothetical protein
MREITINFPLYSEVNELYIGLMRDSLVLESAPYRIEKPIVYYGSSITQGGCASRPGNAYEALVTQALGINHINLGFSGNAKGEKEISEYICSLDMSAFVYDYDHNAPDIEHLKNTHERMFKEIRASHKDVPIIIMTRPKYTLTSEEKINATWLDSLEYESSYQVGYMKEFFSNTEWYSLIPRFNNKEYFAPCLNVYYTYASNKDNSEIVIYFYSFSDETVGQKPNSKMGGQKTGTIGNLIPGAEYTYKWFDPINGEFSEEYTFTASSYGTYYIGNKPAATDMTLLITKA